MGCRDDNPSFFTMSIRIAHISKTFGHQVVLKDVSLSIHKGEVVGLLGPNGAGKSTLMKIILGLWKPDPCADMEISVPEYMGYLPEQNPLYPEMYVREYLLFIARIAWVDNGEERVEDLIRRVGLVSEANKRIGQLSKGYKQRVGLAQALMSDPDVLILDEPTTGFDPNQLEEIRPLIRELGRDRLVILSTHILQEVKQMCDRVIILDHGVIRADEPMAQIADLEQLFHQCTN